MRSRDFEYMRMIAQYRSFSKAAEKLHIAQPALSRYIKKLEEEVGAVLFDRSKTPIELTEAGYRYLSFAENVLREEIELTRDLSSLNDEDMVIRFGAPSLVMENYLPSILKNIEELDESERFEVVPRDGRVIDLLPEMVNNNLDIAVLSSPLTKPGIHLEKLEDQPVIAVLRRDHPALKGKKLKGKGCNVLHQIDLEFLTNQFVFCPSETSLITPLFRGYIDEMNIKPHMVANMDSPYSGMTMATEGRGIWITMPMSFRKAPLRNVDELCAIQIPEMAVATYLVYRESFHENNYAIRLIADWIRDEGKE